MNSFDLQSSPALAPHVRLKIDPVSGDPVLLFPEGLFILNDTAHEIVSLCDGQRTVADILRALSETFEAGEDVLKNDLIEHLEELRKRNLLLFSR